MGRRYKRNHLILQSRLAALYQALDSLLHPLFNYISSAVESEKPSRLLNQLVARSADVALKEVQSSVAYLL